jgi:hypothetical protein
MRVFYAPIIVFMIVLSGVLLPATGIQAAHDPVPGSYLLYIERGYDNDTTLHSFGDNIANTTLNSTINVTLLEFNESGTTVNINATDKDEIPTSNYSSSFITDSIGVIKSGELMSPSVPIWSWPQLNSSLVNQINSGIMPASIGSFKMNNLTYTILTDQELKTINSSVSYRIYNTSLNEHNIKLGVDAIQISVKHLNFTSFYGFPNNSFVIGILNSTIYVNKYNGILIEVKEFLLEIAYLGNDVWFIHKMMFNLNLIDTNITMIANVNNLSFIFEVIFISGMLIIISPIVLFKLLKHRRYT